MRLPVQAPAVLRGALPTPPARLFRGLAPSYFVSGNILSATCADTVCHCGNGTYACCPSNVCCYKNSMCQCGACQ
jgi:hypothetical protein